MAIFGFRPSLATCAIFLFVLISEIYGQETRGGPGCTGFKATNTTLVAGQIKATIQLWQGIVLLICFGAFALFICMIHRIVRTYIFYDAHLLDTFFDGGGDLNVGLIACSVVAKWAWTAPITQGSFWGAQYGVVGPFWYAAGAVIQLFLFAIVAAEIRIKAPGAKTYLQVIFARFGTFPHIVVMIFALATNILISGMVMVEGVNMITTLTQGLGREVCAVVIAIVVGFYTVVGGVGGGIYVCYFAVALIFSCVLVYFTELFYDPLDMNRTPWGNYSLVYDFMKCAKVPTNQNMDAMTFFSDAGMKRGILLILSSFAPVFVDQSFWQTGVAGKPGHSVWGFLTGGLVWFAIPFCGATVFGIAYWGYSLQLGEAALTPQQIKDGLLPVYVSQQMLPGGTGDFLMFVMVMVMVVTTASSQVLAASSIVVYDIYQTYISPFRSTPIAEEKQMPLRMQKAIQNEEYLEYDRRCVVLKHVVVVSLTCLLIIIALIIQAINVELGWLYILLGVVSGSCVLPIILAITWHRMTSAGVAAGSLGGFAIGMVAWLVYASQMSSATGSFREKTSDVLVAIVGTACSLGVGGLLCIVVSLPCGGCDGDLVEEEEWEKTRLVDNPIVPWSVKYAPDIGANHMIKGKPHFYTVRRVFKCPEISAYIFGVLLAVMTVLVWPASMLTITPNWTLDTFYIWVLLILCWTSVATGYIIFVPLIVEIIQVCKQAYYNRMWARSDPHSHGHRPLDEELPTPDVTMKRPSHAPHHKDTHSYASESDFHSTIDPRRTEMPGPSGDTQDRASTLEDTNKRERWKTFIHLD